MSNVKRHSPFLFETVVMIKFYIKKLSLVSLKEKCVQNSLYRNKVGAKRDSEQSVYWAES